MKLNANLYSLKIQVTFYKGLVLLNRFYAYIWNIQESNVKEPSQLQAMVYYKTSHENNFHRDFFS